MTLHPTYQIEYNGHMWRYSHADPASHRYIYTRSEGDYMTGTLHCLLFAGRWPVDQYARDLAVAPGL